MADEIEVVPEVKEQCEACHCWVSDQDIDISDDMFLCSACRPGKDVQLVRIQ